MKSDKSLKGRSVIITGGNRGLGREMAICLAKAGAKLCITASKEGKVYQQTSKELIGILGKDNFFSRVVDVSDTEGMARLTEDCIKKFSKIDVLINNAGRGMRLISETFNTVPTKFWEGDRRTWSTIIDTLSLIHI